jgi:DNA repair protein RadA/Sms
VKYRCAGSTRKNRDGEPRCGYEADAPWTGRCPECGRLYNCLRAGLTDDDKSRTSLAALALKPLEWISTGIAEFDRVLGIAADGSGHTGLVRGSSVLISGEAGAGKTTLLLQVADGVAKGKRHVLYASAEQNARDIGTFAARLGVQNEQVDVMAGEDDLYKIVDEADSKEPALLIIDSINQMAVDDLDSDVNSSRQIEAVGTYLTSFAKKKNVAVIIVAHEAKDGTIRAPQVLSHLVDTVVHFDKYMPEDDEDYDEVKHLRVVESGKNRNGESDVRALLEMTARGLKTPSKKKSKLILV